MENPQEKAVLAEIEIMKKAGRSWQAIADALTERAVAAK